MTPEDLSNKSKEDVNTIFKNHNRDCNVFKIKNSDGSDSGVVRIMNEVIEVEILRDLVRCGTAWYYNNHILFRADPEVTVE